MVKNEYINNALKILKKSHLKATKQRMSIIDIMFLHGASHFTVEEIFNVVNKKNAAMTDANVGFVDQDSGSGDSGPSGYEGMSDAASDQERSEGGRGSRG